MAFGVVPGLNRHLYPIDEWALVESAFDAQGQAEAETIFALANGYLGMRGNMDESRKGHEYGTFINGFHETWPIRHAEEAYGFARIGQTIVNVPDAKIIRLYIDDEPFVLSEADLLAYTRRLDFRDGILYRDIEWSTPGGKHVQISSRRMVSFTERHLAVIEYDVTVLDADASVVLSSQILNRQDSQDEYTAGDPDQPSGGFDPRRAEAMEDRVLLPQLQRIEGERALMGYRAANSLMTIVTGVQHQFQTENDWDLSSETDEDRSKHVYRVRAQAGKPIRLTKLISYHTSRGVPVRELADRCHRTLDRAVETGVEALQADQRAWLDDFWHRTGVEIADQPATMQAVRWNLFQLAQAAARSDGHGVPAKGMTGSGYSGHYFWDTEVYVMPFLSYTMPIVARNLMRFRAGMLDDARERARELNQRGALFPWRTINGKESSAYYAAGTAQYHIDADIAHALMQYVRASGDREFLTRGGADILVETARMWEDLGFWRTNGEGSFHIDGVTGPDEYTTVVDDNLYTNVMAKENLLIAAEVCRELARTDPDAHGRLVSRLELDPSEIPAWEAAAAAMEIPYDPHRRIHPQDARFLEKEMWDLDNTPADKRPLLLNFHPLVIYRFQVLKQADVVLALFLQGQEFDAEDKRRDFEYYDALTTGDSTLSAVVQSIMAAEVGYHRLAHKYFEDALFVDLANLHRNTSDGVHVASTGGIWMALIYGYGGMRDHAGSITFDPRLPEEWTRLDFRLRLQDSHIAVRLEQDHIAFTLLEGPGAQLSVRGTPVEVLPGAEARVALDHQGPRLSQEPPTSEDFQGELRADGSIITASIPTVSSAPEVFDRD